MKKQYLHLSAFSCDQCSGPVVAGWLGVRENVISRETEIRQVGAVCLSCGHRQNAATPPERVRYFLPAEWDMVSTTEAHPETAAFVDALNRAELH